MMRVRQRGWVLATGAAVLLAGSGANGVAAAAANLVCGSVVTESAVLTRDLSCVGEGLVVSGADVILNLGGHTVLGAGTGAGISFDNAASAKVVNGAVRGFEVGVNVPTHGQVGSNTGGVRVARVEVSSNQVGLDVRGPADGSDLVMTDLWLHHNVVGLRYNRRLPFVEASRSASVVSGSAITDNRVAFVCAECDGPLISGNLIKANADGGIAADENNYITIRDNRITGNGPFGISLGAGARLGRIVGNTIKGQDIGILYDDPWEGNVASLNIVAGGRVGMKVGRLGSRADVNVWGNSVTGTGAAGLVFDSAQSFGGKLTFASNYVTRAGFSPDGMVDSIGNPVDDGIHVLNLSGTVVTATGNVARGNAGYGLETYGATDGGGNIARGNGGDPQCVGVVCASH